MAVSMMRIGFVAILAVSFIVAVSLMRVELLAVSLMRVGFVSLMLCGYFSGPFGYFSCQSNVRCALGFVAILAVSLMRVGGWWLF